MRSRRNPREWAPLPPSVPAVAPGPEGVAFTLPLAPVPSSRPSPFPPTSQRLTPTQAPSLRGNPMAACASPPIPSTPARAALTHTPGARLRRRGSRYRSAQGRGAAPARSLSPRRPPGPAPRARKRPGTPGTVVRHLFQRRTRCGADTQSRRVARPAPHDVMHARSLRPLWV